MRHIQRHPLILVILILAAHAARSQVGLNKVAQSTMNFQLVSVSPKASAMGEAFYTVGRGAESIFFNPAGVVESEQRLDLRVSVTQWIADINYIAGAVVWNAGNIGSFGLSFLAVDYGTIHATSLLAPGEQDAYPLGYKDNGAANNVGAYSVGFTYGRAITRQFLIGGNVRVVGQNLGESLLETGKVENNATKLVFDAGVKYYTGLRSFRFGMAIRNYSSTIKREEIEEQMAILFAMGMAADMFDFIMPNHSPGHNLTLAVDFQHPNNYSERMNIGVEYRLLGRIALRFGYQFNQDIASWSTGIGLSSDIGKHAVEFNYSYSNFDIFSGVNRFSLGIAL